VFELFNPQVAVENIGPLLGGLLITVELTLVVITLSLVCALVVALAGMSRLAPLRWLVKAYIEVIRAKIRKALDRWHRPDLPVEIPGTCLCELRCDPGLASRLHLP
jgi:hypothetical protein